MNVFLVFVLYLCSVIYNHLTWEKINCIGILTSGGDAPGMNAAIRAVTRAGIAAGLKVKGIYRGYEGLINNEIQEFTTENVSNIIQREERF